MNPRWILAVAAGLLLVTGIACRFWVGQLSEQHDKIERLPLINANGFRKAKVGSQVLVAGTISERNPLVAEDFVSQITYRADRGDKGARWVEQSRRTPPLWLTSPDGEVHLVNANYRLAANETAWTLDLPERGLHHRVRPEEARASSGFSTKDKVLAFGKVVSGETVAELDATWLYGGTRDSWLDESARDYRVSRLVPWTLWALALVFAGLAFVRR